MPFFKAWNASRTAKKAVMANSVAELVRKGREKLGLKNPTENRVFDPDDGTEIDDDECLLSYAKGSVFVIGKDWKVQSLEEQGEKAGSLQSVDDLELIVQSRTDKCRKRLGTDAEISGDESCERLGTDAEISGDESRERLGTDAEISGDESRERLGTDAEISGDESRERWGTDAEISGDESRERLGTDAEISGDESRERLGTDAEII
ncbi:Thioredoxin domain-containing 2 [Paramuricea clavata]|uniref:Thioredoxin domain-containing 2 n=1 Tax=Paramuricea clavata TaxID=317549 RepID=A0A7D9JP00_PARCT|nr:Thioredoxin domain-containing 2 [Paramuricea clavata]